MPTAQDTPAKVFQFRDFKGMNATDARTAIDDTEFSWLENFIPIGKGQLTIVPGPGSNLTTVAAGIATFKGFVRADVPYHYTINNDGSITQIKVSDGTKTTVAAANTVTTSARMDIWKDTTILFIDPTKGYFSWDGTTFTTIDAARLGIALAVFEGRVWIVGAGTNKRQITFTSPNTFSDFNPANGSGSTTLSDSAFSGQIYNVFSAVEQLWIVGGAAVDTITNVTTVGGVTSFSITNVVTSVGSTFPSSLIPFFRTFTMLTPYGVYVIQGSTPQKLSDKLDGLFPFLTFGTDQPAAVGTIFNVFVIMTLVTSTDTIGGTGSARPLLLCLAQGKWFLATQGSGLKWITSVVVNGSPQLWGTDGTGVYQLFKDTTAAVPYTLKTKLWDFGLWTQIKEWLRFGLEFATTAAVPNPTVATETEIRSVTQSLTSIAQNFITFIGSTTITLSWTGQDDAALTFTGSGSAPIIWTIQGASAPLTFIGAGGLPIVWTISGFVLGGKQTTKGLLGHYCGLTLTGTQPSWTLSAIALQIKPGGEWD